MGTAAPRSRDVTIIALDLETVPNARTFERLSAQAPDPDAEVRKALASAPRFGDAKRACERGDLDAARSAMEPHKLGNYKKADTLLARICEIESEFETDTLRSMMEQRRETYLSDLVRSCSFDHRTLAICSYALYVIDGGKRCGYENGTPRAIVQSWGTTPEPADIATDRVASTSVFRVPTCTEAMPLIFMTSEEQWAAEHALLRGLWAALSVYAPAIRSGRAIVATFNGQGFDVPAIMWRSMVHDRACGAQPPVVAELDLLESLGRSHRPHLDVCLAAANNDRSKIKGWGLEATLAAMGIAYTKPDEMNGAKVYEAACAGEWAKIEKYNLADVVDLHEAAARLVRVGAV